MLAVANNNCKKNIYTTKLAVCYGKPQRRSCLKYNNRNIIKFICTAVLYRLLCTAAPQFLIIFIINLQNKKHLNDFI